MNDRNKNPHPTRLHGLDTLRAFAVMAVLLFHYQHGWSHPAWMDNTVIGLGWTGVDLFFVLSGYLIASQLMKELETTRRISLSHFYLKRSFRILPPFLCVLAVYVFLPEARETESLAPVIKYLTFTQNLGLDVAHHKTFSHAWSLCVEEQFYLVVPLLLGWACLRRSSYRVPIAIGILVVLGILLRERITVAILQETTDANERLHAWKKWVYYPTYARLDGLSIGVLIAWIFQYRPRLREWLEKKHTWMFMLGVGFIVATVTIRELGFRPIVRQFFLLFAVGYGLIVVSAISPHSWLFRLRLAPLSVLATYSYSMYLCHKIVFHLTHQTLAMTGIELNGIDVMLASVAFTVFAAASMHLVIERPSLWLRDAIFGFSGRTRLKLAFGKENPVCCDLNKW
ncbi:MAG: acyltransferase [Planctomycetales bacterium]|nr:acyltransferase [Planctomycetales bacterium]